jgi:hypothetical protein
LNPRQPLDDEDIAAVVIRAALTGPRQSRSAPARSAQRRPSGPVVVETSPCARSLIDGKLGPGYQLAKVAGRRPVPNAAFKRAVAG